MITSSLFNLWLIHKKSFSHSYLLWIKHYTRDMKPSYIIIQIMHNANSFFYEIPSINSKKPGKEMSTQSL